MRVTLYSRTGEGPRFSTTKDENALIAYDVEISDAFSPRWKNGTLYINYGGRRAIEKVLNIYHALPVYSRFENGRYIVAPVQVYNMDGVVNIWREPNKSILSPAARQLYENPELKFTLHPETGALLISPDDYAQFLRKVSIQKDRSGWLRSFMFRKFRCRCWRVRCRSAAACGMFSACSRLFA